MTVIHTTLIDTSPIVLDGVSMPTPGLDGYVEPWRKPEHDDLAELARTFFTKEVLPHARRLEQQGHPDREHYRRAGELGLRNAVKLLERIQNPTVLIRGDIAQARAHVLGAGDEVGQTGPEGGGRQGRAPPVRRPAARAPLGGRGLLAPRGGRDLRGRRRDD